MNQIHLASAVASYGLAKPTQSGSIGGTKYPEFLMDAGASNTLIGLRLIINPLDLIEAEDVMVGRETGAKILRLSSFPYQIDAATPIKSFAMIALSSASSTPASTPVSTLFGLSPTESNAATVATAMRLLTVSQNTPGRRLILSMTETYGSGRYAILKAEVTIDV